MSDDPKGVVGLVVAPNGRVVVSASDFHKDGYGGFTLLQAQTHRVRDALAYEYVRASCNSDMAKALRGYDAQQLLNRLVLEHGFRTEIIPINHPEDPS